MMEFFRAHDAYLAYVVTETGLSRGQWLSLPMIGIGIVVLVYALMKPPVGGAPKVAPPSALTRAARPGSRQAFAG